MNETANADFKLEMKNEETVLGEVCISFALKVDGISADRLL